MILLKETGCNGFGKGIVMVKVLTLSSTVVKTLN